MPRWIESRFAQAGFTCIHVIASQANQSMPPHAKGGLPPLRLWSSGERVFASRLTGIS